MNEEIKEIFRDAKEFHYIDIRYEKCDLLLDYITNLQEELEEEKRIEQADFKTIQNLEEENQRLKELCNKYEEEHNNEFKIWKDERQQLLDYKSRNEKAIEYIKEKYEYVLGDMSFLDHDELVDRRQISHLLNILTGGDEE